MPKPTRQLAAIMFTDIVEYIVLMGKDSAKALEMVRISKDIQKFSVEKSDSSGILPEIKDNIFESFFTTKTTGSGTARGLSLSYDIVKAHGGTILVDSMKNKGTKFIVQLPNKTNE